MSQAGLLSEELERLNEPVAIIHAGAFAYANKAFLCRIGVLDLPELMAIPLLDLVSRDGHEELKAYLAAAERLRVGSSESVRASFAMIGRHGEHIDARFTCRAVEFDGERCLRLTLRSEVPKGSSGFLNRQSWTFCIGGVLLVLFSILPFLLLEKVDISNAPGVYFPKDAPAMVANDAARAMFPNDQVVVMMFEGVALFSDEFLEAFDRLARSLEQHPKISDVFSITTLNHISGSDDGFSVGPLIDIGALDEQPSRDRPAIALADRFAKGALIANDASALAMVVVPLAQESSRQRLSLMNDIKAAVEKERLGGYVSAVSGEVPADAAQLMALLHNNMIFFPATIVVGLFFIWWLFRREVAVIAAGVSVGIVTSAAISLFLLFNWPFTIIASIVAPLLATFTLATLVQLFGALQWSSQRGFVGKLRVVNALAAIRKASLLSHLVVISGLASLGTSPVPSIAQFGYVSAIGLGLNCVVVNLLLPIAFARWDHSGWPARRVGLRWADSIVRRIAAAGLCYPKWVVAGMVFLLAAGLPSIHEVAVETSVKEYFSPSHPYRRDTEAIDAKMVGTVPVDVLLSSHETDGLLDPDRLNKLAEFQRWVESLPEVGRAISPVDFIEEMNWGFNEEDPEFRGIPEDQNLISQYLFVYDGDELGDFLDDDRQNARVALTLNVSKSSDISAVLEQIRHYMQEHPIEGLHWEIAGVGRLFADMGPLLRDGQLYSAIASLGVIFVVILFLCKSFQLTVITILAGLYPVFVVFATMGLLEIRFDVASVLIASIVMGVGLVGVIFLVCGFQRRAIKGGEALTALMRSYGCVGCALVMPLIFMICQFLVFAISDFSPFRNFGLLTALGLSIALVINLLVLPALLMTVDGRRWREIPRDGSPVAG